MSWAIDVGYFPPEGCGEGGLFKRQLVRAGIAAAQAVRAVEPRARLIWAEPLIHVAPRHHEPEEQARAEAYRLAQFEAYDMLTGASPPSSAAARSTSTWWG